VLAWFIIMGEHEEAMTAVLGNLQPVPHSEAFALFHAINGTYQMGPNKAICETDYAQIETLVAINGYNLAALGAFSDISNFSCMWFLMLFSTTFSSTRL
jgi:hypothetical protein